MKLNQFILTLALLIIAFYLGYSFKDVKFLSNSEEIVMRCNHKDGGGIDLYRLTINSNDTYEIEVSRKGEPWTDWCPMFGDTRPSKYILECNRHFLNFEHYTSSLEYAHENICYPVNKYN